MKPFSPEFLALNALAVYRLTRLVTDDAITETARHLAGGVRAAGMVIDRPGVYAFVTCPWCTSIWIAAGVVAVTWAWPAEWAYGAAALAFSAVAGFLKGHE